MPTGYAPRPLAGIAPSLPRVALAQVPSAGQSLRDVEAARPELPAPTTPDLAISGQSDAPVPTSAVSPRIAVNSFDIDGNHSIDAAQLRALLTDLVDRNLDFSTSPH